MKHVPARDFASIPSTRPDCTTVEHRKPSRGRRIPLGTLREPVSCPLDLFGAGSKIHVAP